MFVYSTLANNQKYTLWGKGGSDIPIAIGAVLIKGGTGVIRNDRTFKTPLGVETEITAVDLELLEQIPQFVEHRKNGYLVVTSRKIDPERAAGDLQGDDESQQLNDMRLKSLAGAQTKIESDSVSVGAPS